MAPWALLLAGCVWVPSSELGLRWEELIDADDDGHDDVAYGGDDCDDRDPTVHPGAVEGLGDERDSDCDGEPDGSTWTAVDLRGSQGFRGPRLALGRQRILLAWQAESIEADTTLHDGFGIIGLAIDRPTGPELGAFLDGASEDLGVSGPFDMDAEDELVILARSSRTGSERQIEVHGLDEDLSTHQRIGTEPVEAGPFSSLQVGISESEATFLVGCGQDGAGIHGVAVWGDELLEGSAELLIDAPIAGPDHDNGVCEVDPLYLIARANNQPHGPESRVYAFDPDAGSFTHDYDEYGLYAWVDKEITDEHGFTLHMLLDERSDRVLVMTIASILERDFAETWTTLPTPPVDGDIAPSSRGESWACVLDEGGGLTLYWADLYEQGPRAPIQAFAPEHDDLGDLHECALTVTEDDLVVLAVRSDDGIWLSRFVRADQP
jgi:hypothetical protein